MSSTPPDPPPDPHDQPHDQPDDVPALRAERDELEQRALEAEAIAEDLADALVDAQRQLAERPEPDPEDEDEPEDPSQLSVMGGAVPVEPPAPGGVFAADGSDRALLPLGLAAVAVVVFLVAVVTVLTGNLGLVTLVTLLVAGGLGYAAVETRVAKVTLAVTDGTLTVTEGRRSRSYDLRDPSIEVDVQGQPDGRTWKVGIQRRGDDPIDVDATLVDADELVRRLREHRPDG